MRDYITSNKEYLTSKVEIVCRLKIYVDLNEDLKEKTRQTNRYTIMVQEDNSQNLQSHKSSQSRRSNKKNNKR